LDNEVKTKGNKEVQALSKKTEAPPSRKVEKGKRVASNPNENKRDFGMFTGTATSEGKLDVKKFIDTAMELPTIKKKYRGIKLERTR